MNGSLEVLYSGRCEYDSPFNGIKCRGPCNVASIRIKIAVLARASCKLLIAPHKTIYCRANISVLFCFSQRSAGVLRPRWVLRDSVGPGLTVLSVGSQNPQVLTLAILKVILSARCYASLLLGNGRTTCQQCLLPKDVCPCQCPGCARLT